MSPIAVLLILFFVTLFIGVPFAWSLTISCVASLCMMSGYPLMTVVQKMYNGGAKYTLLAIFFFMLAGAIMQHGGISSRLVNFSKALLGHIRGGLSIAVLGVCMMFAALSGSSIATTAAIGGMMYPELVKEKYPEGYAAALPVAGGTLGIVIPPSIVFVVYGATTGTSVSKLLMSGVIPGVMAGVFMCIYAYFYARKHNIPKSDRFDMKRLAVAFKESVWALLMPIIILGGIYSGMLTATESAAVAVVWAAIAGAFIYRELNLPDTIQIIKDSAKSSAMILFIIAASTAFSWVFTISGASKALVDTVIGMNLNATMFCLVVAVILLIFGTFMEGTAIAVLLVPVLWPIAQSMGINVVHFGMIVCISNVVGTMTPPVAVNIYSAATVSKLKMGEIAKAEIPFLVGYVGVFFLCVFSEWFCTFLT